MHLAGTAFISVSALQGIHLLTGHALSLIDKFPGWITGNTNTKSYIQLIPEIAVIDSTKNIIESTTDAIVEANSKKLFGNISDFWVLDRRLIWRGELNYMKISILGLAGIAIKYSGIVLMNEELHQRVDRTFNPKRE